GPRRWGNAGASRGASYVTIAESGAEHPAELRNMLVVPQLEGGYVIDGVGRALASVRVITMIPLEAHLAYSMYFEPRSGGRLDAIALGRLGLAWRPVDEDEAHLRIGGSLRHWQDAQGARLGGEAFVGLDLFVEEPLVISLEGSIGIVGDAAMFEARGTLGIMMGPAELYAGWHHLAISPLDTRFAGVELTGPIAGLRLWL
nr:hypothetical protein [Myxococcota bacterium]